MNTDSTSHPLNKPSDSVRIACWLRVLVVWLFGIAIMGGTVRLTQSGLSIPDWPIIYYGPNKTKPSILPPFSEQAWNVAHTTYHDEVISKGTHGDPRSMARFKKEFWIEYTHRFLAKTFGIVFLVLLVQVFRKPVVRARIGNFLLAAASLFLLQVILGGWVVKTHTPALNVSIHLNAAFIFTGMIAWASMRLARPEDEPTPPSSTWLSTWVWCAVVVCLLQIFSGGLVANTNAGRHFNNWPMMVEGQLIPNGLWLSSYSNPLLNLVENIVLIQFIHRWLAFGVAALVIVLVAKMIRLPLTLSGRWALRAVVFTLVLQVLLGILTLLEAVPFGLAILHLGTGLVLFLLLVVLAFEARYNYAIYELEEKSSGTERGLVQAAGLS